MNIRNQVVFLTGAAGGIGREYIKALAARGAARIYAADLAASGAGLEQKFPSAPLVALDLDITHEDAVARAAAECPETTLLINNAGVNLRSAFIAADSMDAARREMDTNYFGTLAMCRAFAPVLRANGGGAIINMASILGKIANPALGSYCASKAALLRLTEAIRAELAGQRTHVMAVMPWAVDTPMSGPFPGSKSSPAEVACAVLDALEKDEEDVTIHEMSEDINRRLASDPKALEKTFAALWKK